jgi:hypothetical protein
MTWQITGTVVHYDEWYDRDRDSQETEHTVTGTQLNDASAFLP